MEDILKQLRRGLIVVILLIVVMLGLMVGMVVVNILPESSLLAKVEGKDPASSFEETKKKTMWKAPDISSLTDEDEKKLVEYGRDLIANTSRYLGPNGTVAKLTNGMNCQNCHMDAGTKPFGNNYSAVYSTYPKFRARSGTKETIVKRISDCFERSLNGSRPGPAEMNAMVAYIRFLGTGVKKDSIPQGAGLEKLAYLDRAADPVRGALIYQSKCSSCHGAKGEGILTEDKNSFVYPPLWGPQSYNDAAGLYRISNFAGYVKNNMPFGASYENQLLTDEESWDIAAFVNSQPRPHKNQADDWKDISKKPVDYPYGPYSDRFTERQHKYGPFKPMVQLINNSK